MLRSFTIADLYGLIKANQLKLNPEFQRRDNWPSAVKAFFIDTLLRRYPIPLIYIRAVTDPSTLTTYREVVDGQQRLRTIEQFIDNLLVLDKQTEEFQGKRFGDLDEDIRKEFLAYEVPVEQLINASDDVVLDIFRRINAHGLSLEPQELRHGKYIPPRYKGEFRWAVVEASKRWSVLWERYKVVSIRQRVRMADDEYMAQLLGILLEGVKDGGQPYVEHLYKSYDEQLSKTVQGQLDNILGYLTANFSNLLETSRLSDAPHFLMLFAATAHTRLGIPQGDMGGQYPALPPRDQNALTDLDSATANLRVLADILDAQEDTVPERFFPFKLASAGTTQRIKSRSQRFIFTYHALLPVPL